MLRVLGLLFIGLGATAAALDWSERGEDGFSFGSIGSFWFRLHKESLIGLQSGIENRVEPRGFGRPSPPFCNGPPRRRWAGSAWGSWCSGCS